MRKYSNVPKSIGFLLSLVILNISTAKDIYDLLDRREVDKLRNGASRDVGNGRIVGGEESQAHEFPWLAEIKKAGHHICGGSILNPHFVLTAAHCLQEFDMDQLRVFAGEHNLRCYEGREQGRRVVDMRIHPS